jgi:hypothetical protein
MVSFIWISEAMQKIIAEWEPPLDETSAPPNDRQHEGFRIMETTGVVLLPGATKLRLKAAAQSRGGDPI